MGAALTRSRCAACAAARPQLPQLARGPPGTPGVGRVAPRADRRCRRTTRSRTARRTGSRARAARRLAGQRGGHEDRCTAHDAGRGPARRWPRHRPCLRRARRSRARAGRYDAASSRATHLRSRQHRHRHARVAGPRRGRSPTQRHGHRRTGPDAPVGTSHGVGDRVGGEGCSLAPGRSSPTATRPTNTSVWRSTSSRAPPSPPTRHEHSCCTASGCDGRGPPRRPAGPLHEALEFFETIGVPVRRTRSRRTRRDG